MAHAEHATPININIDKKHFSAPKDPMTGRELKALAGIPANMSFFRDNPGNDPDDAIGDDESVNLRNGDKFYSLPPGRVGRDPLPSVAREIEDVLLEHPDAIIHKSAGEDFFIELPAVIPPAGRGWDDKAFKVLLPVPANYPTGRPPHFFVSPRPKRGGRYADGISEPQSVGGGMWAPACWAPQHSEEARRDLLTCLRFAISRFQEAR